MCHKPPEELQSEMSEIKIVVPLTPFLNVCCMYFRPDTISLFTYKTPTCAVSFPQTTGQPYRTTPDWDQLSSESNLEVDLYSVFHALLECERVLLEVLQVSWKGTAAEWRRSCPALNRGFKLPVVTRPPTRGRSARKWLINPLVRNN